MHDVAEEFPTKSHADVIEFYYNWKFHEPDYSRWQYTKRQIDIALVRQAAYFIFESVCLEVSRWRLLPMIAYKWGRGVRRLGICQ